MYNFATAGYSRRSFILSTAAPSFSGVTTTSDLLGGVTVSGYNFPLSSSAATDIGVPMEMRVATSGEARADQAAVDAESFRSLRAVPSLTATQFFGVTDPSLTVVTGTNVQIFMNVCGPSDTPHWGPDQSWAASQYHANCCSSGWSRND